MSGVRAVLLTWSEAVAILVDEPNDQKMIARAEDIVFELSTDEWRKALVDALVAAVRTARRSVTLAVEREAEAIGESDQVTESEYRRFRAEARRYNAEQQLEVRRDLGLRDDATFSEVFQACLDRLVAEKKIEWTNELLASSFALKDGSRVTWGAATVAQHRERAALFTDLAQDNLHGAGRHLAAINAIERAQASCLNEVAGVPR